MTNPKPRKPNKKEISDLTTWLNEIVEDEDPALLVKEAYIAVFDNFISEGPGYVGKVMTVVWPPGPGCYEVFTWDKDGIMRYANQDPNYKNH